MKIINELNELKRMNKLTSTEQGIVNYILTNPEELEKISSRQLAELTYTSPATVVRILNLKLSIYKRCIKHRGWIKLIERILLQVKIHFIVLLIKWQP